MSIEQNIKITASDVTTALDNKQDKLSYIPVKSVNGVAADAAGNVSVSMMPDYSAGVSLSNNINFTAQSHGIVITCGQTTALSSSPSCLYINGVAVISSYAGKTAASSDTFTAFVKKGDVVKVNYTYSFIKGAFYPLKGV